MSVPPTSPPADAYGTGTLEITQDDKTMAMLSHLLGIFTFWLGPLILYLIKKDQSKFVAYHAMQALILNVIATVCVVLFVIPFLGALLYLAINLGRIVLEIMACLAANKGEWYEIPIIGKYARQQVGI